MIEGLKRLRVVLDANEHGLTFDLTLEGGIPATLEPRHFIRWQERVIFDSIRMAQTGRWTGHIMIGDERVEVTPDRWQGVRDRSWGIRPVGEAEPSGIQANNAGTFYWLYSPMQFDDHAILCIVQEDEKGRRILEEAVRVRPSGEKEYLGRPEYRPEYAPGTRDVTSAVITFSPPGGKPFDVRCTPILPVHLMVGTGYGLESDWRHGMYQGPGTWSCRASPTPSRRTRPGCGGWSTPSAGSSTRGTSGTACSSTGRWARTRPSPSEPRRPESPIHH